MYKGCIEFFSLNNKAISLYNFRAQSNINVQTPCKRWPDDATTDTQFLGSPVSGNPHWI